MKLFLFIFNLVVSHHKKLQKKILNANNYPIQSLPIASFYHEKTKDENYKI